MVRISRVPKIHVLLLNEYNIFKYISKYMPKLYKVEFILEIYNRLNRVQNQC